MKKLISLLLTIGMLVGCGNAGGGGDGGSSGLTFKYWAGSVNGTYVVDASGNAFQFTADNGELYFGGTTYTNATVDSNAVFYFNGAQFGSIAYVKSKTGSKITGLVCNNGYLAALSGSESNLTISCSNVFPVPADILAQVSDAEINTALKQVDTVIDLGAVGANEQPKTIMDKNTDVSVARTGILQYSDK